MTDVPALLAARLASAFANVAGADADPALRRSEHADYQADGALALARGLKRNPREIATEIVAAADLAGIAETEIAGPGFINLRVDDALVAAELQKIAADPRVGIDAAADPRTVVIDYSAPNVAKEMHVGHLRSTIIGDALARTLEYLGHKVIRRNHIGDWGTPFGMLIEHLLDIGEDEAAHELSLGDLDGFYKAAREKFDSDPSFADRSRGRVVALQGGDPTTLRLWRELVDESNRYFQVVYDRLRITLTPDDIAGESSYNDLLQDVVDEMSRVGLLRESDGAQCVFPQGFTNRDGGPMPLLLVKRDGGFNYDTTDLAAIRQRLRDLDADRIVYLTDLGQRLHFELVFQAAREAGWLGSGTTAEFAGFGVVLGTDGKRLRSRAGDSIKLAGLVDEAVRRADEVIAEKNPSLDAAARGAVAEAVGIGAIKYADLSTERTKDYVFDWARMLSFDGNTGPYLQYAHARIRSIFRRGAVDVPAGARIQLIEPEERRLGLALLGLEPAIRRAAEEVAFHRLAAYLYELATAFTAFYEACPVLRSEDEVRDSRLLLCDLTARALSTGLDLLGIEAPDQM